MNINRNPDWVMRGKQVSGLIKELGTFENLNLIVNISLDDSRNIQEIREIFYIENKCILFGGLEVESGLNSLVAKSSSKNDVELLYSGVCNIKELIEILSRIEKNNSRVVISNGLVCKEISLVGKGGSGKFCLLKNCEPTLKVVK